MISSRMLLFLLLISPFELLAQGCSDAGFCTMGAMKPDQLYSKEAAIKIRSIELNQYRGKTTLTPVVYVTTFDLTVGINTRNFFQIKIPYQRIDGNLTQRWYNKPISGLGDISLSFTRNLKSTHKYEINASIGTKIPVNNADLEDERGHDLHMYYQTSLGTFDIVAGGAFITKKWLLATGIQIPVIHNNKNNFVYQEWEDYPSWKYITDHDTHPPGTELRRGTDIMLRAERNFRYSNYSFNIGLLPIFRITPDKSYNPATGDATAIDETTGMALSALVGASYHFNVNSSLKLMYGRKITNRDFNPDGLTRHAVASISIVHRF